jgi:biopolymer transport protein ExbD
MKFPRNARIFRGQLDAAPFACVLLLLVIFLMLTNVVYTPGVRVELPVANDLPGIDGRSVKVAIAGNGLLYFENHSMEPKALRRRLAEIAKESAEPLTLILQRDKEVTCDMENRVFLLARDAGIRTVQLAVLPAANAGSNP